MQSGMIFILNLHGSASLLPLIASNYYTNTDLCHAKYMITKDGVENEDLKRWHEHEILSLEWVLLNKIHSLEVIVLWGLCLDLYNFRKSPEVFVTKM